MSNNAEGRYHYFFKNDGLQNQNVLWRQLEGKPAEVFLDPNTLSPDGTGRPQQILIQPGVTTGILLEHWRGTKEGEILAQLAMHDLFEEVKLDQEPDILGELQDTFVGFINLFLKQRIEELQAKVAQEGLSSEETQELMMLIREVQIEKRNESGA